MRLSDAMNILLRLTIIVIAGFAIWQFSDAFSLAMETLAKPREALWFNVLSALAEGVLGPGLAIAAIALAAANKRLLLAAIIAGLALVIYVMPIVAFIIGIAIYGF
jgi:hypothetical protein